MGLFDTIKSALGIKSPSEHARKHVQEYHKGKKYMIFVLNYFGYSDYFGRNEKKCPEKLRKIIFNSYRNIGINPSDDSEIVMPVQFYKDVVRTEISADNKELPNDVQFAITEYMYPEAKGHGIIITAPQAIGGSRDMKIFFVLRHLRDDKSDHFE